MTDRDDRYSEEMRRALSAAADLVVPAGDGLEKIRARVVHRSVLHAWLVAYTQALPQRIFGSFRVAASGLTAFSSSGSPGSSPDRRRRPHFDRESSWVRPTLAAVGALAIVAIAATVVLPQLNQSVSTSADSQNRPGQSAAAAGGRSSNSASQNATSGLPFASKTPHSMLTMSPTSSQCATQEPSLPVRTSSPSPTDTTPTTYISPSSAPGPSQTAAAPSDTVTPSASAQTAPENFSNMMIGEVAGKAAQDRPVTAVRCSSPGGSTSQPTSVPSTSSQQPTSPPPTTPSSTSSPPTTPPTTPVTTPPPTPAGSQTATAPPPAPDA